VANTFRLLFQTGKLYHQLLLSTGAITWTPNSSPTHSIGFTITSCDSMVCHGFLTTIALPQKADAVMLMVFVTKPCHKRLRHNADAQKHGKCNCYQLLLPGRPIAPPTQGPKEQSKPMAFKQTLKRVRTYVAKVQPIAMRNARHPAAHCACPNSYSSAL
jgi:hypothetical protein